VVGLNTVQLHCSGLPCEQLLRQHKPLPRPRPLTEAGKQTLSCVRFCVFDNPACEPPVTTLLPDKLCDWLGVMGSVSTADCTYGMA
jgi:hypothetical protein